MPRIGVKYPCFGRFTCPRCPSKQWTSYYAWRYYGQMCKRCHQFVFTNNLKKLYAYICSHCQKLWKACLEKEGLICQFCRSPDLIKALDYGKKEDKKIIDAASIKKDPVPKSKVHAMALCEKCCVLGTHCQNKEGEDDPNLKHQMNSFPLDDIDDDANNGYGDYNNDTPAANGVRHGNQRNINNGNDSSNKSYLFYGLENVQSFYYHCNN